MKKRLFPLLTWILVFCTVFSAAPAGAANFDIGDMELHCEALQLINLDTGTVVYEKNADKKMEPASLTKIMTYIVAVENIDDLSGTVITVTSRVVDLLLGTGSSLSGIMIGEELTAMQLLNCLMVPSGNDAAMVLADYVGGGDIQAFVDMMNQKAKELGCKNTHFMNPHGLHDEEHYTTCDDLYLITKYAMELPHFMDICSQTRYTLPPTNTYGSERTLSTTNWMIDQYNGGETYYYRYAKGVKTGSHNQAGYCLVSTAICDGYNYMCIALKSPRIDDQGNTIRVRGEMLDSIALYKWAFSNLRMKMVVEKNETIAEVDLEYAWNQDTLLLVTEKSYATILPKDVLESSVIVDTDIPESVSAPVKKGQVIGEATLVYAGQELTTVNLVAAESVERSELLHSVDTAKNIFQSDEFRIIMTVIISLVVVYIILALIYNRKKKKLRKVKKYRKM